VQKSESFRPEGGLTMWNCECIIKVSSVPRVGGAKYQGNTRWIVYLTTTIPREDDSA
jgi:hypothetical protein